MPAIVISYRREDTELMVGRICDRLRDHYGPEQVLMDIDSIPFGLDFRKQIRETLERCEAMLAIIGPSWLNRNEETESRLADEADWVRLEIEAALAKDIPLIPVLINGAKMPKPHELPETMRDFAFRQATEIDMRRDFHAHMDRLIRVMDKLLEKRQLENVVEEEKRLVRESVESEESEPEQLSTAPESDARGVAPRWALDALLGALIGTIIALVGGAIFGYL